MIQLYHGDCMDFIKTLPDKSVDLVVTDPPYLIETDGAGFFGKKYDEFTKTGKKKPVGERFVMKEIDGMKDGFSEQVLNEICRVLKQINCYFFCSQKQIPILIDFFVNKKKCNWNLLTWHKTNPMPTCGNKYLPDTEFIMFFREKGVKIFGTYETKFTYFVTLKNIKDKKQYKHPTIKPLSIVKNLIINSSIGGGLVLDPFMGSGTTGVAAKELGRDFIGCEISDEYFKIASQRIDGSEVQESETEQEKQPEKISNEYIQGELF